MLRLMGMNGAGQLAALLAVLLGAACTSSSDEARSEDASSSGPSAASADTSKSLCAEQYPAATANESAVAGELRFFGPRPVGDKGNFADLSDAAPVALCLVPDGNGEFAVYGVPEATRRGQRLWTQNEGGQFFRPI